MKARYPLILGALLCVGSAAIAGTPPGKVGLWELKNKTTAFSGPGDTSVTKYCMTAAAIAAGTPFTPLHHTCKAVHAQTKGSAYSADLLCSGMMTAKGRIQCTFDTQEHFSCSHTLTGVTGAGPQTTKPLFTEGRWLKADCGAYGPKD